ncbi:unnamed protein product [Closterium sp. NIES-53]
MCGRAVDFEVWLDDLQLFLQCDRADGLSLFDLTSGLSPAPPATAAQRSGSGGGQRQQQQRSPETPSPQQLHEWYAGRQRGGGAGPCTYVLRTGDRTGEQCGGPHSTQRCFGRLTDAWRHQFPDATEIPRWGDLSRAGVAVFDLDYDAILAAMYALSTSDEGDCYLCVPPDPGIEAAALGAGCDPFGECIEGASLLEGGAASWRPPVCSSGSWRSESWGSESLGSESRGSASWGSESWGSEAWGSESWGSELWGPAPSGVSQVDAVEPVKVAVDSGAAPGAEPAGAGSGGAGSGGVESGGAETWGAEPGGAEPGGAATGGAEPGVTEPGGAEPGGAGSARVASGGASSRREVLSPRELREWFAQRWSRAAGAGVAGVGPTGGSAGVSGGTGAAGSAGPAAVGATGVGAAGGSADAGPSKEAGAGAAGAGGSTGAGAPAGSPGAVPAGSGGASRPRPYFVLLLEQVLGLPPSPSPAPPLECPQPVQSQSLLQPVSPLPAPSPYSGPTGGLAERRALACALSTDVLEDRQEDFQCFAAALPHLVSTLLAPEGD